MAHANSYNPAVIVANFNCEDHGRQIDGRIGDLILISAATTNFGLASRLTPPPLGRIPWQGGSCYAGN